MAQFLQAKQRTNTSKSVQDAIDLKSQIHLSSQSMEISHTQYLDEYQPDGMHVQMSWKSELIICNVCQNVGRR